MFERARQWIPLLGQLEGYGSTSLRRDVVAGLTTAIMLVPQAMAYALLAGLEPIVGLYASVLPLFVYSLLGTSRQLAVGPVAMISLLVASAVAPLAGDDAAAYAGLASLLALLAGGLQWAMGAVRLGFLVKFLSHPVIAGFTSAAALIIGFSQLKHVLGIPIPRSHHVHEIIGHAIAGLGELDVVAFAIAAGSIATLLILKRFAPGFPRFLLVVAGGALATWGLELDVSIVGDVPSGLPGFTIPPLSLSAVADLLPMAITIALVGFMESISVAKNFARRNGYEVDADQELVALGAANVAGAFFGAYPTTGGFSRTAVNAQAGAKSGVAGLVTAAVVVLTLLFLTPLFTYVPKAVLAAIIMTAVFGLVDVATARHLWRVDRADLALMGLTFVATLTLGIEQGILAGVGASLLWFVWRMSRPHVAVLGRLPGTTVYRNVERYPEAETTPGLVAVRVDAPLFFSNTAFLKQALEHVVSGQAALTDLVIDAKPIGSVDSQALDTLAETVDALQRRGITIWMAGVRGPVRDALKAVGIWDRIGAEHFVERVHEAVDRAAAEAA